MKAKRAYQRCLEDDTHLDKYCLVAMQAKKLIL
jgi:hypothetical protein